MVEAEESTHLSAGQQDGEPQVLLTGPDVPPGPSRQLQEGDGLVAGAFQRRAPVWLGLIRAPETQERGGTVDQQRLVGERPSRPEATPPLAVAGRLHDPPEMLVHRRVPRIIVIVTEPGGLAFDHDAESIARTPVWNLVTDHGRLDIALRPSGTEGYDDLVRDAIHLEILGVEVDVASLADVVRSKEAAGREKDRLVLPVLRRIMQEDTGRDGRE